MKKKIITMLLATLLVLFLVVVPSTVAAAGEYTIRLADTSGNSTVSAYAGDTVKVVLSIANNPGITGVGVKVNYPAGVSLAAQPKDVSGFSSVASVNRVFSQNTTDDPYVMWWNMALGDSSKKLVVKEGNLAELTFKIADNATPGDYKITLTAPADMNRTANVDGNKKIIDNSIVSINNIVPVNCIIRVKPAPVKITKQPANSTAAEGKTVSTTVKATGDGLTYTWYYKNASASSYAKSSVKSATYSTKMSTAVNGRKVYCVIKDQYGNTVTSNTVTLKGTPVKIATQPVSVTVAKGATAKVTVKATGDGLTYKWYYKDKGASKFTLTKSFTGNTYSVAMNASRSGRQLYCKVTDKYGNTVTTKTVTISMKVAITKQPVSVTVANGKTAKVTVSAAGEGLTYKWYYKKKGATKFSLTTSFTGASYSLKMDASRSGRQVYCKVTDKFGNTVKTNTVTLKMK